MSVGVYLRPWQVNFKCRLQSLDDWLIDIKNRLRLCSLCICSGSPSCAFSKSKWLRRACWCSFCSSDSTNFETLEWLVLQESDRENSSGSDWIHIRTPRLLPLNPIHALVHGSPLADQDHIFLQEESLRSKTQIRTVFGSLHARNCTPARCSSISVWKPIWPRYQRTRREWKRERETHTHNLFHAILYHIILCGAEHV